MGRTYTSLTYHLVFSTKYRRKLIQPHFEEELYQYIGGIIRKKKGVLLEIGGTEDHLHLMTGIPSTIAVSDMVKIIKTNSSGWISDQDGSSIGIKFAWQPGFGAFTVSHSQKPFVSHYLKNQKEHHKTRTYKEEFLSILVRHGIDYDPKYVFEEEYYG